MTSEKRTGDEELEEEDLGELEGDIELLLQRERAPSHQVDAPEKLTGGAAAGDVYQRLTAMISELPVLKASDAWHERVRAELDREAERERSHDAVRAGPKPASSMHIDSRIQSPIIAELPPKGGARDHSTTEQGSSPTAGSATEATRKRRLLLRGVSIAAGLAVAAGLMLWIPTFTGSLEPGHDAREQPRISLELRHGETAHRALDTATVGDHLLIRGTSATAISVYLDGLTLIARCPGGLSCRRSGTSYELEISLGAPGEYRAILLHGEGVPPEPSGAMEQDLRAAQAAGFSVVTALPVAVR